MNSIPNRREILKRSAAIAGIAALGGVSALPAGGAAGFATEPRQIEKRQADKFVPNRIAISTYSFWRFRDDSKLKIPDCIALSADWGFDGVELLRIQMEDTSDAYLQSIKRQCFLSGMDLVSISTHQGFVSPDAQERKKNVEETIGFIEMAYQLGIPVIRINTGRWNTSKNFDELMANKGIEKRLDGYSDEDGFGWVIDSIEKLLPTAEKCGVLLGLENHWGLGRDAEGVLRIIQAINHPWLKALLDTGNFLERQEEQYRMMAPHTCFVQAKTYFGGGTWYDLEIDYNQVARILQEVNYRGYVSLEFEGKEDYRTAIPKSLELLRKSFGTRQTD